MEKITVQACANIALIKYWGKRDEDLFLPTKSSLSISLPNLQTTTSIQDNTANNCDDIIINNKSVSSSVYSKTISFLDKFRKLYNIKNYFKINTQNNFATAAGLASSSSGLAALSLALDKFCKLNLSKQELSILARQGSGSACRSIYDGFVLWHKGVSPDGSDSYAQQLFDQNYWPEFKIFTAVVSDKQKPISSRIAMQQTIKTSSYYNDWLIESEARIPKMIEAIKKRDFHTVGMLAQEDCLGMHKAMQLSKPSINYWLPETLEVINKIKDLQQSGVNCYFTIDAGPNVKVICLDRDLAWDVKNKSIVTILFK